MADGQGRRRARGGIRQGRPLRDDMDDMDWDDEDQGQFLNRPRARLGNRERHDRFDGGDLEEFEDRRLERNRNVELRRNEGRDGRYERNDDRGHRFRQDEMGQEGRDRRARRDHVDRRDENGGRRENRPGDNFLGRRADREARVDPERRGDHRGRDNNRNERDGGRNYDRRGDRDGDRIDRGGNYNGDRGGMGGYNDGEHDGMRRDFGGNNGDRRANHGFGRGDNGRGRGVGRFERVPDGLMGERRGRPVKINLNLLNELKLDEPANIVMTLSNGNTDFKEALLRFVDKPDIMNLMVNVLAKACTCDSMPELLNKLFTILKEVQFFDKVMNYFLDMQAEESVRKQESLKQPIKDILTIMEQTAAKHPTSIITQFVGIHGVLNQVINHLRENAVNVVDGEILTRFRHFTDLKEKVLHRKTRNGDDERERQMREDAGEPPDDFREIPIFPQTADMETNDDRYLRSNKIHGRYHDLDHYLDVQFRLLREDFIAPLRDGIGHYIQAIHQKEKGQKQQNVRIYTHVRIIAPECSDSGLCHVLQFDVSVLGNVNWRSTKRLIFGSLLCLSSDNFNTCFFATVTTSEARELAKGIVSVRFEHDYQTVKNLFGQIFTMAETTAYFESYRHVLAGLKHIQHGEFPFERYIVKCENDVHAPAYLQRRQDAEYDLRPLVDDEIVLTDDTRLGENIGEIEVADNNYEFSDHSAPAQKVKVLERKTWPPADLLHLDDSQFRAIHTALTKEFVITQGPPGTGKTYIGLKIVKALLHNKHIWSKHPDTGDRDLRPMLIVCYTNHALDQFLEGIIQFYTGDVLRVGSRSNSEILKPFNLSNFRQRFRHAQKIPFAVFQGRREAKSEMDLVSAVISKVSNKIQVATTSLLREDFLKPFMDDHHYYLLTQQFEELLLVYPEAREFVRKDISIMIEWLELGDLAPIVEMEGIQEPVMGNLDVPNNEELEEDEMIDVQDEIDNIRAHRRLEEDDEDDDDEIVDNIDELVDLLIEGELTRKKMNRIKLKIVLSEQEKAVALNVDKLEEKPNNMNETEWQKQKKARKRMKKTVQKNLASTDKMTDDEAKAVKDMWRMPLKDKWRLYRYWVQRYCDSLMDLIGEKAGGFEQTARRYKEALLQEDKEIMRHSTIIGMTTTGAARYQSVLQEIRPRIIVVEEAAEVLEAHVVTTLSRGCEHLILIGDHKQLKPNPTVYKLATDYNLDVSLFERMVKNGMRCDRLELQHRMRPEISKLMRHIYDGLKDHDDVKNYECIKGISKNIFFINHDHAEEHNEESRSHTNRHEARYLVALCRYLLLQGYNREQITILTLYSGQLFCLRNMMPKEEFEGVRVTVVDNYQGEENDIILLSLVRSNEDGKIGFLKTENRVCVALSRAKKGFYVIGNFELLTDQSKLWNEVVVDMKQQGQYGDGLALYCQNHPDENGLVAIDPKDFHKAPEGGCEKKCNFRLDCGHVCEQFCHVVDREHKFHLCRKRCDKILCKNHHHCEKYCSEPCGNCMKKVPKKIPRCGHTQQVPCFMDPSEFACNEECSDILPCGHRCQAKCGMAHTVNCDLIVEKLWPCGHSGKTRCHKQQDDLCPHPCNGQLDCEHRCLGTCGKCFQGRLHMPCKNDCKRILVCGHECTDKCNQCPPCTKKCENRCLHSKCNRRCGESCVPCMEPCGWRCAHYRCGKLCNEPCDRPRCDERCQKELPCGHQCIGLCGEPCPTDCKVCHKEKVTELLFGYEDEPDAKFVLLEDCSAQCIIESSAMDKFMDQIDERREIKLKECPKCKTPIRTSNRYRQIINKALEEIESVKKKVLVNRKRIKQLESDINDKLADVDLESRLVIKKRFHGMFEPRSENALAALFNQLSLISHLRKVEDKWKMLQREEVLDERTDVLKYINSFAEWILEERSVMTPQESVDAELELARLKAHLKLLLHCQKARDMGKPLDGVLGAKISKAKHIIKDPGKYVKSRRLVVEECLEELKKQFPLDSLGITDDERVMIVSAMALPKGHWFTCPQGHVYAIADCGGATNESKCPECGCTIGGMDHRLRDDNRFFGQMDGAEHPAWSEQANLGNYGFHVQF